METRTLLQILLGIIASAVVVLGVLIVWELTRSPETIFEKTLEKQEETKTVEKNPWEDRAKEAISLVEKQKVADLDDQMREEFELGESTTVGQLVEHEKFLAEKLKIGGAEPSGWEAEWWGETKYGAHYYRVTYGLKDGALTIGPTWLVSLKEKKVVPKNVTAKVATNPEAGVESEYYDKADKVVSAMTKHTFKSGINLAGTLLLYFEQRASNEEEDTILGWTIQHDRENLFKAYFQWQEGDESTYAEFEFDYDRKRLKAVNLHAGNIMRVGEQFEDKKPVDIMPRSFDPEADRPANQWTGRAAKAYRQPKYRDRFRALGTILNEKDLISSLEWLLTAQAKTAEQFEECKQKRKCSWKPEELEEDVYRVTYVYNVGSGEQNIEWKINLDDEENAIEPVGRISKLAYRVVNPRN